MHPTPTPRLLTAEEFCEVQPEDMDCELVAGHMVVEPLPRPLHGRLSARIAYLLLSFTDAQPLGEVFDHSGFVLERGPDTVRGPGGAEPVRNLQVEEGSGVGTVTITFLDHRHRSLHTGRLQQWPQVGLYPVDMILQPNGTMADDDRFHVGDKITSL